MFNNQIIAGAAGQGGGSFYSYTLDQSLRLQNGVTQNLTVSSAFPTATDRKKVTISFWYKRSLGSSNAEHAVRAGANGLIIRFNTNGTTYLYDLGAGSGGWQVTSTTTNRRLRDPSAWYHFALILDSTQATDSDRAKLYVNGELWSLSTWSVGAGASRYPNLNASFNWHTGSSATVLTTGTSALKGYASEFLSIDGQDVTINDLGETVNGVWVPKEYTGSFGNAGFHLDFANSSAIGNDVSGNNVDFTADAGFDAHDVVPDSPTNNFATWNPIGRMFGTANTPNTTEGTLRAATAGNSTHIVSTFGIGPSDTQGYYWEVKAISLDTARSYVGILAPEGGASTASAGSYQFYKKFVLNMNGNLYGNNDVSSTNVVALTSWTTNDILMFAYKDGKFWIGKNGTWMNSGDPAAGTGDLVAQDGGRPSDRGDVTWFPYAGFNSTYTANFGQDGTFAGTETAGGNSDENGVGDFKYSVPSGFLAMCSANRPELAIGPNSTTTNEQNFNTVLYTGDGTSSNAITGVGFQPDFVWIKTRNGTASHALFDSVRGADNVLRSNGTDEENASAISTATYGGLTSFDSDGFTVDDGSDGTFDATNGSSDTYVSWNWKAGGTASTIAVDTYSAGVPSIASSVSANQDAGFSVVSYSGVNTATSQTSTIGHGLASAPELIICKRLNAAQSWSVGSTIIDNFTTSNVYSLDSTSSPATTWADEWGANPTSTVFTTGYSNRTNISGGTFIAYCFHSVEGFSKVGTYYGNTTAYSNGVFVYTGFRPAFVMTKAYGTNSAWVITDNERNGDYNGDMKRLIANTSAADASFDTNVHMEFYSNGFSVHATTASSNENRINQQAFYVYLAFAQAPFKYANAR